MHYECITRLTGGVAGSLSGRSPNTRTPPIRQTPCASQGCSHSVDQGFIEWNRQEEEWVNQTRRSDTGTRVQSNSSARNTILYAIALTVTGNEGSPFSPSNLTTRTPAKHSPWYATRLEDETTRPPAVVPPCERPSSSVPPSPAPLKYFSTVPAPPRSSSRSSIGASRNSPKAHSDLGSIFAWLGGCCCWAP